VNIDIVDNVDKMLILLLSLFRTVPILLYQSLVLTGLTMIKRY